MDGAACVLDNMEFVSYVLDNMEGAAGVLDNMECVSVVLDNMDGAAGVLRSSIGILDDDDDDDDDDEEEEEEEEEKVDGRLLGFPYFSIDFIKNAFMLSEKIVFSVRGEMVLLICLPLTSKPQLELRTNNIVGFCNIVEKKILISSSLERNNELVNVTQSMPLSLIANRSIRLFRLGSDMFFSHLKYEKEGKI